MVRQEDKITQVRKSCATHIELRSYELIPAAQLSYRER
jgi:hypothetical protein